MAAADSSEPLNLTKAPTWRSYPRDSWLAAFEAAQLINQRAPRGSELFAVMRAAATEFRLERCLDHLGSFVVT
jgi:hypothetical protein